MIGARKLYMGMAINKKYENLSEKELPMTAAKTKLHEIHVLEVCQRRDCSWQQYKPNYTMYMIL